MNQNDLTALLRPLDAAPRSTDDTARRRRDAMLERILAAPAAVPAATRASARHRPIMRFALGGAAAVLLTPALLIGGTYVAHHFRPGSDTASASPFTETELASWITTPEPRSSTSLSPAVKRWCTSETDRQAGSTASVSFSSSDQRGAIASTIITRGAYRDLCIATSRGTGTWEILDGPGTSLPAIAARAVGVQSAGSQGDPATSIDTVWGQAGSDVTKMVLHVEGYDHGITATVGGGIWNAWWPSTEVNGDFPQTATVTYKDGSVKTTVVQMP